MTPDPSRRPGEEQYLSLGDALAHAAKPFVGAVAEYRKARNEASDELNKLRAACLGRSAHPGAPGCTCDLAWDAFRKAENEAWVGLGEAVTSDRLAAWVVANVNDFDRGDALEVLEILPCTLADIDKLADENDWCGNFLDYRDEALDAGVVTETATAVTR